MLKTVQHHAKRAFPALTQRNFQIYFAGQFLSLIGTWMQITAEQWLIYPVLTQSKILLGLVGVAANLPTTILVLFTGVFADRVNKKKLLLVTQSLFMLYAFILFILISSGKITIWYVIIFALLNGVTFAFEMPARQAFIVETVEKKIIPSAISLNAGAWNAARTIGPPIAGFLIAAIGIAVCYLLNSLSFLAVIVSLLFIKTAVFSPPPQTKSLFFHFKEGVFYVLNRKEIFSLFLALGVFTVFSFSFTTLLPVFTYDIFHADERVFGLLGAGIGIGATIGAFGFSLLFNRIKQVKVLLLGISFLNFASLSVFAFSQNLILSFIILVFVGFSTSTFVSTINTLVQLAIPNDLRGRVMSFYSLVFIGSMPFGSLYAGTVAHFFGAPLTVFLGVLLSLITLLYIYSKLNLSSIQPTYQTTTS